LPRPTNPNRGARADPAPPFGWDETRMGPPRMCRRTGLSGPGVTLIGDELKRARGLTRVFSAARCCCAMPTSSVGGSNTPLVPKQHHRVAFFQDIYQMPCIKSDAPWAQSWMAAQRGLPPGVESDASWVPSWMTAHIRARHVWWNSYSVFSIRGPSQAPSPSAAYYTQQRCTCSSQAPCWGGGSRSSSSRATGALSCGISRGGSGRFGGMRSPPLV
jgi:hypothetical protein